MNATHPGRFCAAIDGAFVVFLIGMRVNRLWALHRWAKPAWNTYRMVRHLRAEPPKGYLGGELFLYPRGVGMFQYWRSFEELEGFAKDRQRPHAAAWAHLVRQTASDSTFGYWHETFSVRAGDYECIYGSMPRFGLARAANHVRVGAQSESARERLDVRSEP
jgi:Monooxygenase af470-like